MVYIIGEIGQNHNGSIEIAKALIDISSTSVLDEFSGEELQPLNAVKLTKRDLSEELSASQMKMPYDNSNSFGKTYGEHRAYLELPDEAHYELYKYAKEKRMDFVETFCSKGCLSLLKYFKPDKVKVASRDLTNIPLLETLAETKIPLILSTGMSGQTELDDALSVITRQHDDIAILHCLSQYPAEYKNINLNTISFLQEKYPQYTIGYSDHSIGISIPVAAVAMGAQILEKHITLDRRMRGSDHRGSLGIDGLSRMVRDIRNVEHALGEKAFFESSVIKSSKVKLERSIATKRAMNKGAVIKEDDVHLLSPGDGFKWSELKKVVGKRLVDDMPANEILYTNHLEL